MRAHFPDNKSAALACEQIVSAGYPLNHFTLIESKPAATRSRQPIPPVSLWDRLITLFGSGSLQKKSRERDRPSSAPETTGQIGETVLFSADSPDAVVRAIILQHGGYLEPSFSRPPDETAFL